MDLTVIAIPAFFGSMGAEHLWQKAHAAQNGPTAGDYEWHDTVASLSMGVGSLLAPLVMPKLLGPVTPGKGRYAKVLLATAAGAAVATTVADALVRREELEAGAVPADDSSASDEPARPPRRERRSLARRVARAGGVASVVAGVTALSTAWASRTAGKRLWDKRLFGDRGRGPLAVALATVGWDAIYYWNHRVMHESRFLWAIHVVHHSSERYNLSTALRQPVADAFGVFVPYSTLALLGFHPEVIETARGINLLYQFWIHTETIPKLGPLEEVLNTPSHHRVHHGSNRRYLDRNHGSIFIVWDRLFGTFEREDEPVVYGLTKNIDTFNPARVAAHEHYEMLQDVARSRSWRERLSYVLRGPGWAYEHRAERDSASPGEPDGVAVAIGVRAAV